jgi:hypothetical protein
MLEGIVFGIVFVVFCIFSKHATDAEEEVYDFVVEINSINRRII